MADDEAIALYGMVKKMAEAMAVREKVLEEQMGVLDAKTAVLDTKIASLTAVIAELKLLPRAIGQQTGQYIAAGVRESIQADFSVPLEEAVDGPIGRLNYVSEEARRVLSELLRKMKFQNWRTSGLMVLAGVILGVFGSYFFLYNQQIGQLSDRINKFQQLLMAPTQPAPVVTLPHLPGSGRPPKAQGKQAVPKPKPQPEEPAAPAPAQP